MATKRGNDPVGSMAEHLLYLLENAAKEKALHQWLNDTPPDEVTQALTRIAFPTALSSESEKAAGILTAVCFIPMVFALLAFFTSLSAAVGDTLAFSLMALFVAWSVWATRVLSRRMTDPFFAASAAVRKRALLLLAERGHYRALQQLAAQWSPWGKNVAEREWINAPLETMLFFEAGHCRLPELRLLRSLLRRSFPASLQDKADDFADAEADVLLAALRCLAIAGGPRNQREVSRVAQFPVPQSVPNRALLRDMAVLFLDDPHPAVPVQRGRNAEATLPATNATVTIPERKIITLQRPSS